MKILGGRAIDARQLRPRMKRKEGGASEIRVTIRGKQCEFAAPRFPVPAHLADHVQIRRISNDERGSVLVSIALVFFVFLEHEAPFAVKPGVVRESTGRLPGEFTSAL